MMGSRHTHLGNLETPYVQTSFLKPGLLLLQDHPKQVADIPAASSVEYLQVI